MKKLELKNSTVRNLQDSDASAAQGGGIGALFGMGGIADVRGQVRRDRIHGGRMRDTRINRRSVDISINKRRDSITQTDSSRTLVVGRMRGSGRDVSQVLGAALR